MNRHTLLVATNSSIIAGDLAVLLRDLGHCMVGSAGSGDEAVKTANNLRPDIVIIDTELDGMSALDTVRSLTAARAYAVIISTDSNGHQLLEQAAALGASGYLIRPFSRHGLQATLALTWFRFRERESMTRQIEELRETLRTRKLIEQAKGLLMERERISEATAYRLLQNASRNKNVSMASLAEAIILSDKLKTKADVIAKLNSQPARNGLSD